MTRALTDRVDAGHRIVCRDPGRHSRRDADADALRVVGGASLLRTTGRANRFRAAAGALVLVLSVGSVGRAQVPTGDAEAGRAIVQAQCNTCHAESAFGGPPRQGPSLQAVATMPSTTSTSLHVFLMTPHPTMPNYRLSPQEIDDVVAYILSLRR